MICCVSFFLFHTLLLPTRQILFSLLCSLKFFHQSFTVGAGNKVGEWEKSHDLVSWSKGMCQSERALYILGFFSIVFRDNHILNNKTNSTTNRRVQQRRLVIFPSLILLLMLCWNFLECLYVCILVTYRPNTHTHTFTVILRLTIRKFLVCNSHTHSQTQRYIQ